jgi:hypothetical protein
MTAAERSRDIQLVREFVHKATQECDALGLYTRCFDRYPFDMMGLGILSKAFSLAEAIFLLLDAAMEDQAYALCRSVVECSLSLRYLTEDPNKLWERTDRYMRFAWPTSNTGCIWRSKAPPVRRWRRRYATTGNSGD